ncbi:ATP-binding protein [Streptomyces sp. NPDC046881]|uniref:ATP-binding protein n=1 Tax=Streptomyces sp. NPDC046881 TaxID=3155374 RepID=UPI0033D52FC4
MLAGRRLVAEDGTPVVSKSFRRNGESVRQARQFVHAALLDWKLPDLADAAELVASELATNAVQHARCDAYRVTLRRLDEDRVRVAVVDRSKTEPQVAEPGDEEEHGRGLALVEAMSTQWGTDPLSWGKRVWADLEAPQMGEMPDPRVSIYATGRARATYVLIVVAVAALVIAAVAAQH